jgi:hypothetical protein
MKPVSDEEIIRVTKGWVRILRRHAREANKAASHKKPEAWTTDRKGWETLRDQLRAAAKLLDWFAKERAAR